MRPLAQLRRWPAPCIQRSAHGLLTADECGQIRRFAAAERGRIATDAAPMQFLFERIETRIAEWNAMFGFELEEIDAIEVARLAPGVDFAWREDLAGGEASRRKLTLVASLDEPAAATGGRLELYGWEERPVPVEIALGDALIFPAWTHYRIGAVSAGERAMLIARILGPPFR